ncbi:unnamed protein product [Peronospora belbahrii]|uniref:Telomere replication protein EST3 n=1 Tax=Peronospora belbahrii TaxID=622444 RepID=A0AAU9KT95_9STRA|nr:unnamed protein product [Peronospora belbahrii]
MKMTIRGMNFTTDFLLRELLVALGGCGSSKTKNHVHNDSFSESLSEETESQCALEAINYASSSSLSRVMIVRRTNSSQETITLVDRMVEIDAFISDHVVMYLQQERGYETLGKLRGSIVRVMKYQFATLARCIAMSQARRRETSVSVPDIRKNRARVYLWIDSVAIVEDNELAVTPLPRVDTHPLVAERLEKLNDLELEKQLMITQGLLPLQTINNGSMFHDDRPLVEEDCVIPEDQEQELEKQDEWGRPAIIARQVTDSELIEENGPMSMSESQVICDPTSPDKMLSMQESMTSSGELSVASATTSTTLSENPSTMLSEEMCATSPADSQRYAFQQENIRETFVVGSDSESSDTDSEYDGVQTAKKLTLSTPKARKQAHSRRRDSHADSNPAPTNSNTTQSSWVVVDLTGNSSDDAPIAIPASKEKATEEVNLRTDADDTQNEVDDNAAAPPRTHSQTKKQMPSAGWATSLLRMVGFGTSAASVPHAQSSAEEADNPTDQNATPMLDQTEMGEAKIAEPAKSEELMSSQATVVLQYNVGSDDDAHAFEYEGMLSDDIVSPRSAEHGGDQTQGSGSAVNVAVSEEGAEDAPTPKKSSALQDDTTSTNFETLSLSTQAVTPQPEKQTEPAHCQIPASMRHSNDNLEILAHDSSRSASPLCPHDRVLQIDHAAHCLLVQSPCELAGPTSSRIGFSTVESRGIKRRRQQTNAEINQSSSTTVQAAVPASQLQIPKDDNARFERHRRQDIFSMQRDCMDGSQSPQFEQPALPRSLLQSAHGNRVTDSYSLDALCRSLGSRIRDTVNERSQTYTSQQPRRAWKKYENLFPPLNTTRRT